MVFRPLSTHPAFLPLVGAIAAIVALILLQLSAPPRTEGVLAPAGAGAGARSADTALAQASASAAPAVSVSGTVSAVRLAREDGGFDSLQLAVGSERVRVVVTRDTSIAVWTRGRRLVGGPEDIAAGQRVDVELVAGAQLRDGARAARMVVTPTAADAPGNVVSA